MVNNNYIDLEYAVIENCGWIVDVDPETGVLPFSKTGTVVVTIDRDTGLQPGVNETVIVVKTSDGSSELTVSAAGIEKRKATLNVLDATDVMASSARLNAEITDAGAPSYTKRGFVYSESPMPDFDNTIVKMSASVTDDKTFSVKIDGLELAKTYYVRAYAVNEIGDAVSSNQISFTTVASLPEISLDGINTNVSEKSATLYGLITNDGDPEYYAKGFVYSTNNTYPTIYDKKIQVDRENHGNFEASLPSIEYDIEYYVRAYAVNDKGVAYGDSIILFEKNWLELPEINIAVQKEDIGQGSWHTINQMCENSIVEGFTDWRLPTLDELYVIYNNRDMIGNFVTSSPKSANTCYWSSDASDFHTDITYYYLKLITE